MRLLRAENHRRMPWKNGGGVTTEIAIHPDGAALDAFDWRLSMAQVAADGPFSIFPGIDRVLAVLDGEGLSLAIAGAEAIDLTQASNPLAFAADVPVHGTLAGGPVTDLNLMVRRGTTHSMRRLVVEPGRSTLALDSTWTILFSHDGGLAVETGDGSLELGPMDALVVGPASLPLRLAASRIARLFVIQIG